MAFLRTHNKLIFFILILILLIGGYYFITGMNQETTDDATIEAHVMIISPKISGYVKTVPIEDNMRVKAGDLLLEIDPRDYIIKRDRAAATLEMAEHNFKASSHSLNTTMVSAPSNLEAASAQVTAAKANWEKAQSDLKRLLSLSDEARSREELDRAIAAEKTTRSELEDAHAKLTSAQTAPKVIASAKSSSEALASQVKQAQAELDQAEKDLADTKVYAAFDGKVTRHSYEVGDYVQTGAQLGFVVGTELWVVANFKETQLKNMKVGDHATIKIDAFPDLRIDAKIASFQAGTGTRFSLFPPENATGNFVKIVQRIPVKLLFDAQPDPKYPLGPGMSVYPTVYTR